MIGVFPLLPPFIVLELQFGSSDAGIFEVLVGEVPYYMVVNPASHDRDPLDKFRQLLVVPAINDPGVGGGLGPYRHHDREVGEEIIFSGRE